MRLRAHGDVVVERVDEFDPVTFPTRRMTPDERREWHEQIATITRLVEVGCTVDSATKAVMTMDMSFLDITPSRCSCDACQSARGA